MIVVYVYLHEEDRVVVITVQERTIVAIGTHMIEFGDAASVLRHMLGSVDPATS